MDGNRILTRDQVRKFDQIAIQRFGIHPLVLMENAARGACDALCDRGIDGPVVICCGPGNNGGDGIVMARHLHIRGFVVSVLIFADVEHLSPDSLSNLQILTKTSVPVIDSRSMSMVELEKQLDEADWIVDALLGTGAKGPLRSPLDWVIPVLNDSRARRMAVDIPTGLDCDLDQEPGTAFSADLTCTFVALKPVMQIDTGKQYCGSVKIVDIGAPPEVFVELAEETASEDVLD